MKSKPSINQKKSKKVSLDAAWVPINLHAAGVDIGSREHWICVPQEATERNVRKFGTFTADLEAAALWLKECGVTSIAMEATGVYWIPLFQILERNGFDVILVNARQTKNVAGRKSDVQDCQWIARLHTYGLLQGSFRPEDPYCVLRTYLRYRDELVSARSTQGLHIQKALLQMNIQLPQVLSDVTGVSGLAIIGAILEGQRDPVKLVALVDRRVRATTDAIQQALKGDYRTEHLFVLRQAYELYHVYEARIIACDEQIVIEIGKLPVKANALGNPLPVRKPGRAPGLDKMAGVDMRVELHKCFGVDLTSIEGIGVLIALTLLTEVGPNVERFHSEKHYSSWLGLCPDNRISGGKVLSSRTRRVVNRATDALRLAASTLERSQSALGGFARRMKAKLGAAEGITATAHKLARLVYRLIKHGETYVRQGLEDYEKKFADRKLKGLQKAAKTMGFEVVQIKQVPSSVS